MQRCNSRTFGEVEYEEESLISFPRGLPGFESEKEFIPVEREDTKPLLFLQSVATAELCFITIPIRTLDSAYQLKISDEDLILLRASAEALDSLLCLAIVCISGDL